MFNTKKCVYISLFFTCSIFANNTTPNIAGIVSDIGQNNDTERKLLLEKQKHNLLEKLKKNKDNVILGVGEIVFGLALIPIKFARLICMVALCDGARRMYNHNVYNLQNNEKYKAKIEEINQALILLTNKIHKKEQHD